MYQYIQIVPMKEGAVPGMCLPGGSRYFVEPVHMEADALNLAGISPGLLSGEVNHATETPKEHESSAMPIETKDTTSGTKVKAQSGVVCRSDLEDFKSSLHVTD